MPPITNRFWIGANIIIDTATGATSNVLMIVNRASDATAFYTREEATQYLTFVRSRIRHINWDLDPPTPKRPDGWLIQGLQTVAAPRTEF